GTNTFLPPDIRITWVKEVGENFDARFSARSRRYLYVIQNTKISPAIFRDYVSWEYPSLDAEKMHHAGQYLLDEHDFSAFRARECQSHSAYRNIINLSVQRQQNFVILDITANAFLHHMVRNI